MSATNLITQSVISGLQAQIDVIQNNLLVANANLQSVSNTLTVSLATNYSSLAAQLTAATNTLTNSLNSYNNTLTSTISSHASTSYATAHGGLSGTTGTYRDSGNDEVGSKIVDIVIAGVHYYVPASPSPAGVCHSDCGCASNCGCAGDCAHCSCNASCD